MINDLSSLQNDPNFLMQQQQYLNQFYLQNGYMNPYNYYYYQLSQLMNQNLQNQNMMMNLNMGVNHDLENDVTLPHQPGQEDINQLFNNLALLNQENKATNEDKEDNEE